MLEIVVSNIEKSFGGDQILKGVTFSVNKGTITGVVGKNGCGKSTLFKIMTGSEYKDAGEIHIRSGARCGYLEQLPNYSSNITVNEILNSAFTDVIEIEAKLRELEHEISINGREELLNRYAALQLQYENAGGFTVQERLKKVIQGLKIDDNMMVNSFSRLSGGEKTRVLLAKLLLLETDILLLDEPTNHLDIQSIEWLERFLVNYNGTVLIISHDRYFLDKVADNIVEIENGKAMMYKGNYSKYVLEKEENFKRQKELYERQQKEIKRLEVRARQLHEWADNSKLHRAAFNIEKRIARMEKIDKPVSEKRMVININSQEFRGKEVIIGEEMYFSFQNGKSILENADLSIYKNENIGILGPNGCGKTTFLKILNGELSLDKGLIKMGKSVKYAYLPQEVIFERPERSILELVAQDLDMKEPEARNLLGRYNFKGEDVFKEVSILSGGEKSRLRLCMLLQRQINVLILDEPTNHLDIASKEAVEDVLMEFDGALIFVSHDRYFINKFADKIIEMEDRKFIKYEGRYDFYREEKLKKEEELAAERKEKTDDRNSADNEIRQQRSREKDQWRINKVKSIEDEIENKENLIKDIDQQMFSFGHDYDKIVELEERKKQIGEEINGLLKEWEKYSI